MNAAADPAFIPVAVKPKILAVVRAATFATAGRTVIPTAFDVAPGKILFVWVVRATTFATAERTVVPAAVDVVSGKIWFV